MSNIGMYLNVTYNYINIIHNVNKIRPFTRTFQPKLFRGAARTFLLLNICVVMQFNFSGACDYGGHCLALAKTIKNTTPDATVSCKRGRQGKYLPTSLFSHYLPSQFLCPRKEVPLKKIGTQFKRICNFFFKLLKIIRWHWLICHRLLFIYQALREFMQVL